MSSEEADDVKSSPRPRWERSESPPDPWGDVDGAGADGEWRFDIIGEEVDYDGTLLHEVRWDDWHRADGTKTTWELSKSSNIDSAKYTAKQKKRRHSLATDSLEIDIVSTADVHNTETFLRSQAYDEKLLCLKNEKPQPNRVAEMAALMAKHQEHIRSGHGARHGASSLSSQPSVTNPERSRRESTRQLTETSLTSSSTTLGRAASRAMSASSSVTIGSTVAKSSQPSTLTQVTQAAPPQKLLTKNESNTPRILQLSLSAKAKGKQRALDIESSPQPPSAKAKGKQPALDFESSPQPTDYSFSPRKRVKRMVRSASSDELMIVPSSFVAEASQPTALRPAETPEAKRQRLQNEWTRIAKKSGAAPISFANDVDDEGIPPLEKSFVYLERDYKFAHGIEQPDSGFLTSCDCDSESCGPQPVNCGCQDDWELDDFAYTPSGLYAFNVPKNREVIECNKACACNVKTCVNSVSQRPRDVPIEIFKTEARGWGVRSRIPVQRGKVLGIYTGLLIRREVSRSLPAHLGAYCFDLDGDEMVDESQPSQSMPGGKYSVDSRVEGNWTRFINHSCSPNLEIYLVVHDKPAGCGMPYIAFVANQQIPALTEFTFDYHPEVAAQIELKKKKSKKKAKLPIPEGAAECLCGSRECRGYLD